MNNEITRAEDVRCLGCGKSFTGERGLRAHQSARFQTAACKPRRQAEARSEVVGR